MRRLLRILLNAVTVLSLVLCAATMAAWVRSYLVRDEIAWSLANPRLELDLFTYRGGLIAGVLAPNEILKYLPNPGARWEQRAPETYAGAGGSQGTFFNHFGFAFAHSQYPFDHRFLASPYWFITLLTAILPGARLAGWRRRARRLRMRPGLCQHCGYDCRTTPDRCPECGRATGDETSRSFHRPVGSLGARGAESPPISNGEVERLRRRIIRTLDSRPSPSRPAGPRGC